MSSFCHADTPVSNYSEKHHVKVLRFTGDYLENKSHSELWPLFANRYHYSQRASRNTRPGCNNNCMFVKQIIWNSAARWSFLNGLATKFSFINLLLPLNFPASVILKTNSSRNRNITDERDRYREKEIGGIAQTDFLRVDNKYIRSCLYSVVCCSDDTTMLFVKRSPIHIPYRLGLWVRL